MSALGPALEAARKERNVTQKQLAAYFKCTQAALSMIESGELTDISKDFSRRIKEWIASGRGAVVSAPRGAYRR